MATTDLKYFDSPGVAMLPDGHPRRGMSVVAALSEWLVHSNRRRNGSWMQRYEHGIPLTDLAPIADDGTSGTTVHFLPDVLLVATTADLVRDLRSLVVSFGPQLTVDMNLGT